MIKGDGRCFACACACEKELGGLGATPTPIIYLLVQHNAQQIFNKVLYTYDNIYKYHGNKHKRYRKRFTRNLGCWCNNTCYCRCNSAWIIFLIIAVLVFGIQYRLFK